LISRRDGMTAEERATASARIAERMAEVLAGIDGIVALYAAKGSEVDTTAIDIAARARGLRVVYPRVVDGERVLAFHEVGVGALVSGRHGLREPQGTAPVVSIAEIAAFVVPGVAFDREGGRLGWGKGYYDATLAGASGLRVGLAFECQVVDAVAREEHDVLMQLIVTEVATHVV
jgi:5-formyltetrahydrofolate cyclo-ligase